MRHCILLLILVVSISSCHQTKLDNEQAYKFLDSVDEQMNTNSEVKKQFLDELTNAERLVYVNQKAIIDTKQLQQLYEDAKKDIDIRMANLASIKEFDENIGYKQKTIAYAKAFKEVYEKEFPLCISILAEQTNDRFERTQKILKPKMESIKKLEVIMTTAKSDFERKYTRPEKPELRRTGKNYNLVPLKNLKFQPANLEEGSPIKLISFSGGDDTDPEGRVLYKQFIGIAPNGDTVRILSIAMMQHYDIEKAPREGIFKTDLTMRKDMVAGDNEYVIFNTELEKTEKADYKTAFGLLQFN
jgi:hypothetical protein